MPNSYNLLTRAPQILGYPAESSTCAICNEAHYTNHLSDLINHIRPSAHTSARLVVQRSGIDAIIPEADSRRLFDIIYPFTCASHYRMFSQEPGLDPRAHCTHFGCLANALIFSALDQQVPQVEGQDAFFFP